MPGLTYTLKADATGVEKGFQTAQQAVDKFKKKNAKAPLLQFEGDLKAERNIVGLVTDLSKANSATEVLSAGMGRLGDVFQNSLATGVVLALGSAFFDMGKQANEAFNAIRIGINEASSSMSKAAFLGNIQDVTDGLKTYEESMKNIRAEENRQQSVFGALGTRFASWSGGPGVQEAANEVEKEKSRLEFNRAQLMVRIGELADDDLERARLIADADEEGLKNLERELDLKKKIADITMSKLTPEAKERAIGAVKALADAEQRGEIEKKRIEGLKKDADKEAKQIDADEARKKAAEKAIRDKFEKQLTLGQRMQLARERLKEAQDRFRQGGKGMEKAQADVAEAQGKLQDVREEQIQRIMGGSTSAAAAQRAERREQRARARAERILDKRQEIRDADAAARAPKAKPAEMNLQGGPQKDPVEAAVKTGNTMLGKVEQQLKDLNQRLTVA